MTRVGSRRTGRIGRWLLVAAVSLAGVPALFGSDEDEAAKPPPQDSIVTDRPTQSASPVLVPRTMLQFELGYRFTRLDTPAGRTETHELPDMLVRFGISEKVEARLTATGWAIRNTETGQEDGLTDVSLGTKIALVGERGHVPKLSLLVDLSVPVGDPEFTARYVIPKVLFLGGARLSEQIVLTYNAGPSFVTRKLEDGSRTDVSIGYAVALSGPVGGGFNVFGEAFGSFVDAEDLPDRHAVQVGSTVLLHRSVQFDFRGGLGLVNDVPDWFAGVGIAFRVPLSRSAR